MHPWYTSRAKSCCDLSNTIDRSVVTPSGAVNRQMGSKQLQESECSDSELPSELMTDERHHLWLPQVAEELLKEPPGAPGAAD